ncbi:MAG: CvpA family protein [Oleibacter sp.]|nr:CvpA family protein [Thalassolituus sp.]
MTEIDWVIVAVIGVSSLISLTRGFIKEALSLASWVIAFFVARYFSANLSALLIDYIEVNSVRAAISFALLFACTLFVLALVNYLLAAIVNATGLSGTDRVLGMAFGAVRGLVILVALVFLGQQTPAPTDSWWQNSVIIPHLETLADWARKTLPSAVDHVMTSSTN